MRILVLGRGVIGTQYGWALEKAGNTVDFYVRKKPGRDYADHMEMHTYDGRSGKNVDEKWDINIRYEIPEGEKYDLVLVSVNPEQVEGAVESVSAVAGDATVFLLGNSMGNPLDGIKGIDKSRYVIGFPGAGGGITGNELHGIMYKSVSIGISGEKISDREKAVRDLFKSAGFKVSLHSDIRSWLVNHYVLNAAMEIEVLKRGSFENVVASKEGLTEMFKNARELVTYLRAKGVRIDPSVKAMTILPPALLSTLMKRTAYKPGSAGYNAIAYNRYNVGYAVKEIADDASRLDVFLERTEKALMCVK